MAAFVKLGEDTYKISKGEWSGPQDDMVDLLNRATQTWAEQYSSGASPDIDLDLAHAAVEELAGELVKYDPPKHEPVKPGTDF